VSDSYLALVEPTADAANAHERAGLLHSERIILAETSDQCVYGGVGHLPGPRLNESYAFSGGRPDRPPELRYWDMLAVCGVEIHADKWVNMYGFTVFEWARCPSCDQTFKADSEIMNPLYDAVGDFINNAEPSMLKCPACERYCTIQSWVTQPHLGLCHLAVQFWNWPDFNADGWRISIPDIASRAIGCSLISTYGRM
jgi:hypothetical protein